MQLDSFMYICFNLIFLYFSFFPFSFLTFALITPISKRVSSTDPSSKKSCKHILYIYLGHISVPFKIEKEHINTSQNSHWPKKEGAPKKNPTNQNKKVFPWSPKYKFRNFIAAPLRKSKNLWLAPSVWPISSNLGDPLQLNVEDYA